MEPQTGGVASTAFLAMILVIKCVPFFLLFKEDGRDSIAQP